MLLGLLALMGSAALAERGRGHGPQDPQETVQRWSAELGLSEAQEAEIRAILEEHHTRMRGLREAARAEGAERGATREQGRAERKAMEARVEAVLSDDQATAWRALREEHRAERRKRHGEGRGRGAGGGS